MALRFGALYVGGVYHIFNRGVDKRVVFTNKEENERFVMLLQVFNQKETIKSVRNYKFGDKIVPETPLVEILAYTLQGNHYHLLLEQVAENGISAFMHKLSTAYTNYFNAKHGRTGALFQGKYKYIETKNEKQILRLICYINKNEDLHSQTTVNPYSSRKWYATGMCPKHARPWRDLFGNYQETEQTVINQIKMQRNYQEKELL